MEASYLRNASVRLGCQGKASGQGDTSLGVRFCLLWQNIVCSVMICVFFHPLQQHCLQCCAVAKQASFQKHIDLPQCCGRGGSVVSQLCLHNLETSLSSGSSLELSEGPAALHKGYLLTRFQSIKYQRISFNVEEEKNSSLTPFLEVALFWM